MLVVVVLPLSSPMYGGEFDHGGGGGGCGGPAAAAVEAVEDNLSAKAALWHHLSCSDREKVLYFFR
jgi:hypothetical protein